MRVNIVKARKILDSRGNFTIEVEVNGQKGSAPSGASTGSAEATTFPKSVDTAVEFVNGVLAKELIGKSFDDFESLKILEGILKSHDSTERWEKVGGSLVIALEFAMLHAMAAHAGQPLYKFLSDRAGLPRPLGNCVGGGAHAGAHATDIQEFLTLSLKAKLYSHALFANAHAHKEMKNLLQEKDHLFTGGKTDEGAWAPNLTNIEILDILQKEAAHISKKVGFEMELGLDMASSELFDGKKYVYKKFSKQTKKKALTRKQQIDFVLKLIKKYKLVYVEDPLEENDFEGFAELTKRAGNCLICGDDLIATNPDRLQRAIAMKAVSAIIVKPNQIGSLVKTKQVIDIALENNIIPVMSHRSGETCDDTIAHLAVAFSCPIIKCGDVGGERLAKLNELLRIEETIEAELNK